MASAGSLCPRELHALAGDTEMSSLKMLAVRQQHGVGQSRPPARRIDFFDAGSLRLGAIRQSDADPHQDKARDPEAQEAGKPEVHAMLQHQWVGLPRRPRSIRLLEHARLERGSRERRDTLRAKRVDI